ncbi:MAG: dNTP triphosphohydrolase [Bryobacterales bacterium]|nr:dNTP triphosphohydrolase [Bryobacterales bacterium]MBV9397266.1 dNTP triphosphohydrolase [Bryobacterales bacterium]
MASRAGLGTLAHLRFPLELARGRRYPEAPHRYRNDFQRDRDRVVHARAFRRLENKTQVFSPGISDHFRNRLTHTIEVSQVARTVASVLGLDEDLTEALALAHDIGHPPFAHAGEEELHRLMRGFGDSFDHNRQALRIVESFENPYPRFPGLNLTFEVREGIVKHSRDFEPGEIPELEEYLPGLRPPLEAQLIDLCDEIAYNTADLDDGYSAGLIAVDEACAGVPKFRELWESTDNQFPGASERVRVHEVVRGLMDWLVTGLIEGTIAAAEPLRGLEEIRRLPARVARFSPETAAGTLALKRFLRLKVYCSEAVVQARSESAGHIAWLFDFFLRNPGRMPANYREESSGEPLHRQVCDYIAGMTDGFFAKTYEAFRAA